MKNSSTLFFRVSFIFSVAATIFSLFCFARLTDIGNDVDELNKRVSDAENKIKAIYIKQESDFSVKEIEDYAKNVLHMVSVCSDNVIYLESFD